MLTEDRTNNATQTIYNKAGQELIKGEINYFRSIEVVFRAL
jgi:hypothetical protein